MLGAICGVKTSLDLRGKARAIWNSTGLSPCHSDGIWFVSCLLFYLSPLMPWFFKWKENCIDSLETRSWNLHYPQNELEFGRQILAAVSTSAQSSWIASVLLLCLSAGNQYGMQRRLTNQSVSTCILPLLPWIAPMAPAVLTAPPPLDTCLYLYAHQEGECWEFHTIKLLWLGPTRLERKGNTVDKKLTRWLVSIMRTMTSK